MKNGNTRARIDIALLILSLAGIIAGAGVARAQAETIRLQMPLWAKGAGSAKSPGAKPTVRIDSALRAIARDFEDWRTARLARTPADGFRSKRPFAPVGAGYVTIDAVAEGDAGALLEKLTALGMKQGAVSGPLVSGRLPLASLPIVETLPEIQMARPSYVRRRVGSVASEGDASLRADASRAAFGVDGRGITVGVLSDSFDCLGGALDGVRSGDLPDPITVLQEAPCADDPDALDAPPTDEGRAMLEIVHDLAPGASLAFHTALGGQAHFARGIQALQAAGAKIIVDDVIYLAEPMFQDGVVAQAVDRVAARGTAYFSAAGNEARQSYERRFRNSARTIDYGFGPALAHDFDPGSGVDPFQRISVPPLGCGLFVLQWSQPFRSVSGAPGSATDIDILLLNTQHTIAYATSLDDNKGSDPVEILEFCNDLASGESAFDLVITRLAGESADRLKYIHMGEVTLEEFDTRSGTVYGHANAAGAEAVGAADFLDTAAFGRTPAALEPFSSAGGVPILFDVAGLSLPEPSVRRKPGIVAADGVKRWSTSP